MKIKISNREYDCGDFTILKYNKINTAIQNFGDSNLFNKSYTKEMTEEIVETICIVSEGQIEKEKLMAEGDIVEMLVVFRYIQAEAIARFNEAVEEIDKNFSLGGDELEESPPQK